MDHPTRYNASTLASSSKSSTKKKIGFIGHFADKPETISNKSKFTERLAIALEKRHFTLTLLDYSGQASHQTNTRRNLEHVNFQELMSNSRIRRFTKACVVFKLILPIIKASWFLRNSDKQKTGYARTWLSEVRHNMWFSAALLSVIRDQKFDTLIVWNSAFPRNILIRKICKVAGINWLCAEGGIVPDTIEFDDVGNHFQSIVIRQMAVFSVLPLSAECRDSTRGYLNHIKETKVSKKFQKSDSTDIPSVNGPVIFCVGVDEDNCGIGIKGSPTSRAYSPYFRNEGAFIDELARLAIKNQWNVLYKPHPNNKKHCSIQRERITVLKDGNIFDIIDASDVVTTLASSVAVHAILQGRQVVLAGANAFSGFKICHEISNARDLETAIKSSLALPDSSNRRERLLDYAARASQYQLFSYSENGEKYGLRNTEACAKQIAHFTNVGTWGFSNLEQ